MGIINNNIHISSPFIIKGKRLCHLLRPFILLASVFFFLSCTADKDYKRVNAPYYIDIPANFPKTAYDFEANPPTELGVQLGKRLFYEGKLSANGFISCGFCHEQRYAFTHHEHQFSHGIDDLTGIRNTPAIQNGIFMESFGWDGGVTNLDLFATVPITEEVEMGETIGNVLRKLKEDKDYPIEFAEAFEDGEVNLANMLKALGQFMATMISSNSKYDKYVRGEPGGDFTVQETKGLDLFRANCASCHATDMFTDNSYRNTGLTPYPGIDDLGRKKATGENEDKYKFKVPSLRNVEITKPYMHDGRYGSLRAVLNHYTDGVTDFDNLDPLLRKADGTPGLDLNIEEKEAIIAFLITLTDKEFLKDERFSEY